jgi:Gpi18-like mannosyltransferase
VVAVLGLRLFLTLSAIMTYVLVPGHHQSSGVLGALLGSWRQFDALRFTAIAAHGYGADGLNSAYMPVYPLLIRIGSILTLGHYLTAALLISNLGCVLAIGLLWRWAADCFDEKVAWRTIAVLLIYPDSFYLLGAYSESLFLALNAATLLATRRDRPILAGILALAATLTRLQGLVLCIPILLSLRRRRDPKRVVTILGAAALPGVGLLVYQKALSLWLGGDGILNTFQDKWHIPLLAPWQTIGKYITVIRSPAWRFVGSNVANYVQLWDLVSALIVLAVLLLSARRLGLELTIYGLAAWCFAMSRYASTGRYMLAVLPAFIGAAIWLDHGRLKWLAWLFVPILFVFTCKFTQGSWID